MLRALHSLREPGAPPPPAAPGSPAARAADAAAARDAAARARDAAAVRALTREVMGAADRMARNGALTIAEVAAMCGGTRHAAFARWLTGEGLCVHARTFKAYDVEHNSVISLVELEVSHNDVLSSHMTCCARISSLNNESTRPAAPDVLYTAMTCFRRISSLHSTRE